MVTIGKLRVHVAGLAFYGVLIVAIVVGAFIGGGTGTTIAAIGGAVLALTLLAAGGGTGIAARDAVDRRGRSFGRPLDDEEQDDLRE